MHKTLMRDFTFQFSAAPTRRGRQATGTWRRSVTAAGGSHVTAAPTRAA